MEVLKRTGQFENEHSPELVRQDKALPKEYKMMPDEKHRKERSPLDPPRQGDWLGPPSKGWPSFDENGKRVD